MFHLLILANYTIKTNSVTLNVNTYVNQKPMFQVFLKETHHVFAADGVFLDHGLLNVGAGGDPAVGEWLGPSDGGKLNHIVDEEVQLDR